MARRPSVGKRAITNGREPGLLSFREGKKVCRILDVAGGAHFFLSRREWHRVKEKPLVDKITLHFQVLMHSALILSPSTSFVNLLPKVINGDQCSQASRADGRALWDGSQVRPGQGKKGYQGKASESQKDGRPRGRRPSPAVFNKMGSSGSDL